MCVSCVGILVRPSRPIPILCELTLYVILFLVDFIFGMLICGVWPRLQIRSAYRTVELSQGFEGPLATSEGFFYGLDTFPLFLAIAVYIPLWPGQFINDKTANEYVADEKQVVVMQLSSGVEEGTGINIPV